MNRTFILLWTAFSFFFSSGFAKSSKSGCKDQVKDLGFVAIVDGYGSGSYLHEVFRARGFRPISILTTKKPLKCYEHTYCASDYDHELLAVSGLDKLIARLSRLAAKEGYPAHAPLVASVAGSEPGVPFNDELTEHLNIASNGTAKSAARRFKEKTQQVLRDNNLEAIREILTGSVEEALTWIDSEDGLRGSYPVVVKPNSSAGTDGFTLCYTRQEVIEAFTALVGNENKYGKVMTEVLVQEYLKPEDFEGIPGGEYVINIVSRDGTHIVSDGWLYHKIPRKRSSGGTSLVYDWDELIEVQESKYKLLIDYALKVVRALEMKVGPSHLEIMMTARGPVLIEIGARLMGGGVHKISRLALGTSALDLTVDAYDPNPTNFNDHAARGSTPFPPNKKVAVVQFLVPQPGYYIPDEQALAELEKLKQRTLADFRIFPKKWSFLKSTVDLQTSPGTAVLIGDSWEEIHEDLATLRRLEKSGLFRVQQKLPWHLYLVPKRWRHKMR